MPADSGGSFTSMLADDRKIRTLVIIFTRECQLLDVSEEAWTSQYFVRNLLKGVLSGNNSVNLRLLYIHSNQIYLGVSEFFYQLGGI